MHPRLRFRARKVFRVQLYKNNARVLLLRILSILNSDWLQHVSCVRGVYEWILRYLLVQDCIQRFDSVHAIHSVVAVPNDSKCCNQIKLI